MTSKEYYKQTSDMAFLLDDVRSDGDCIEANVFIGNDDFDKKVENIVNNNDFFAIKDVPDGVDFDYVQLKVTFIRDKDAYDVYSFNVVSTIDCRRAGDGCYLVLSCNTYTLEQSYRKPVEDESKKNPVSVKSDIEDLDVFKGLSDAFGFPEFPSFTFKFPDISKMFDEMLDGIKSDSPSKFVQVSYSRDADGNVHWEKKTNDGVVTKDYNENDKESKKLANNEKVELKDLLK